MHAASVHFEFQGSHLTCTACAHAGDVGLADNPLPPAATKIGSQPKQAAERAQAFTGHHNTQFLVFSLDVSYES